MKHLYLLCLFLVFGTHSKTFAQLLPVNQPEQDACGALKVCGNGFFTPYSYQGEGVVADLTYSPCGVPGGSPYGAGENNVMWLRLTVTVSGTIVFKITPVLVTDDYDFAVVDITNTGCSNFSAANVVRCNFNNNVPVFNNGEVGLNMTSTLTGVQTGDTGSPYCRYIDAVAGQTYLIMINNFGIGGSPSQGFTINFTGSTAVFSDNVPPHMSSLSTTCYQASETVVQLSEPVKCSSIALNGSDFQLSSGSIAAAEGINCNASNQGYTDKVRITFGSVLGPGTYTLRAKKGSDNNTLLDLCDNALALPDSLVFTLLPDTRTTITLDTAACGILIYKGITYTQNTVLRDTLRGQNGCDSLYHVVNITVFPNNPVLENITIGGCDSVIFRGKIYRQNDVVADTFYNYLGCDSLVRNYRIYVERFALSVAADPPEPVIGDLVTFTTSANVPDYAVNAWYPRPVFTFQLAKENSIFIQHSDTVKVIATSALGCIDTAILYIRADTLVPVVVMPNAFSPNGDGLNDVFEPRFVNKSGYVVKDFKIYNRWGQMVFKAQGTRKAAWNGYYYNEDKRAAPGVYYYRVYVEFIDGTREMIKGDVTIVP